MSPEPPSSIQRASDCAGRLGPWLGLCLACFLAALPARADNLRLKELPAAVQATIQANRLGGNVEKIKEIRINDYVLYLVEIDLKGFREATLYIAGDGALRKVAEEIRQKDLPEPVRLSLERHVDRKAHIDDIEKVTIEGEVRYEVEIEQPKRPDRILIFEEDGTIASDK